MYHVLRVTTATVAAACILAGCSGGGAQDPLEFLPQSVGYAAVNGQALTTQKGFANLSKMAGDEQKPDDLVQVVFGVSNFTPNAKFYGYIRTKPGALLGMKKDIKAQMGATETKVAGRDALVMPNGGWLVVQLSDQAAIVASDEAALQEMTDTASKKNPGAKDTPLHTQFAGLADKHALSVVVNAEPLMGIAAPQLMMASTMDPKGVEALRQVKVITAAIDYDTAPRVEAVLKLDDAEKAKDLAALVNQGLGMAKSEMSKAGNLSGTGAEVINAVEAKSDSSGVSVVLELTEEQASAMAAQAAAMSALMSMGAGPGMSPFGDMQMDPDAGTEPEGTPDSTESEAAPVAPADPN